MGGVAAVAALGAAVPAAVGAADADADAVARTGPVGAGAGRPPWPAL